MMIFIQSFKEKCQSENRWNSKEEISQILNCEKKNFT